MEMSYAQWAHVREKGLKEGISAKWKAKLKALLAV